MTTDDIAKLAEIMAENDLSELSLEEEGTKLRLERGARIVESMAPVAVAAAPVAVAPAVAASPEETAETEEAPCISSPIVGTFYTAPSPDADVFANVGDRVNADT
ncbi:MAG: acetyl-CoA carboxylase, biotin carboxyl carrier protein, partial [Lentisphaeria bacterium]|nr:acetyl-CoA carboxylase, biotin carboxyl carrier protein [Lentisphaeria bacterium]